jgi:hypothetical protein
VVTVVVAVVASLQAQVFVVAVRSVLWGRETSYSSILWFNLDSEVVEVERSVDKYAHARNCEGNIHLERYKARSGVLAVLAQ